MFVVMIFSVDAVEEVYSGKRFNPCIAARLRPRILGVLVDG